MDFLVLCAPKSLEVSEEDHHLHARHARAKELQDDLTALLEPDQVQDKAKQGLQLLVREGGVAAALGSTASGAADAAPQVWIAARDERIAVFKGTLKNLKQLEDKFLVVADGGQEAAPSHGAEAHTGAGAGHHGHAHHAHPPPMPPVPETAPAPPLSPDGNGAARAGAVAGAGNPAAVVLAAYEAVGAMMLSQLQGRFALCMFDAQQLRVLAARDGSGAVPLLQARTPRGGMVLSTCPSMMACCHDTLEFEPGFFKYGWLAAPRLFTPQALQHPTSGHSTPRRSLDLHPHHAHHHGHQSGNGHAAHPPRASNGSGSRRSSLDHGPGTPPSSAVPVPAGQRRASTDAGGGGASSAPTAGASRMHPRQPASSASHLGGGAGRRGPASLQAADDHLGRGSPSPGSSTSSGGGSARRRAPPPHPPQGKGRPHSAGGAAATASAVAAVAAGVSHLRVEAAPFVPAGVADGAAQQS